MSHRADGESTSKVSYRGFAVLTMNAPKRLDRYAIQLQSEGAGTPHGECRLNEDKFAVGACQML